MNGCIPAVFSCGPFIGLQFTVNYISRTMSFPKSPKTEPPQLRRQIGVIEAVFLGLGSILGTGIFVSIGIATTVGGRAVILAAPLAAVVAMCNGLSSAQLAANHPVSGGTYEYGYRWLSPSMGFLAGWMFLIAKSASAATAAAGVAAYLVRMLPGLPLPGRTWLSIGIVLALTLLVLLGLRRSAQVNAVLVAVTLAGLGLFIFRLGGDIDWRQLSRHPLQGVSFSRFFEATALLFVAYTGYGRIATLGEEIHEPAKSIPRAIIATLVVTAVLYTCVAVVLVGTSGAEFVMKATADSGTPLEAVAVDHGHPWVASVVTIAAMVAMSGVLLNLILGLSRVALAMGRRGDVPRLVSIIDDQGQSPYVAVLLVSGIILAILVLCRGDIFRTWSLSAWTVLIYYSLTNLSALRLRVEERLYSPVISWCGLGACLMLAFQVQARVWQSGVVLLAIGLLWHVIAQRWNAPGVGKH